MEDKYLKGNKQDELECSECDFKCFVEYKMIAHSAVHSCSVTKPNDIYFLSYKPKSAANEIVREENNVCTSKVKPETNYTKNVDSQGEIVQNSEKIYFSADNVHNRNNEIKFEDIDIDDDNKVYNDHNIQQDRKSLKNPKIESIGQINETVEVDDMERFTAEEVIDDKTVSQVIYSIPRQGNSSQNHVDVPEEQNKSDDGKRIPDKVMMEMDADNHGIYIPEEWQRKIFQKLRSCGNNELHVAYCSPDGTTLWSGDQVNSYCSILCDDYSKSICAAKMNFSTKRVKCPEPFGLKPFHGWKRSHSSRKFYRKKSTTDGNSFRNNVREKPHHLNISAHETYQQDSSMIELDVDNSEIQIPEGWQRKVFEKTHPDGRKMYYQIYTNPEGKLLCYDGSGKLCSFPVSDQGNLMGKRNTDTKDFSPYHSHSYKFNLEAVYEIQNLDKLMNSDKFNLDAVHEIQNLDKPMKACKMDTKTRNYKKRTRKPDYVSEPGDLVETRNTDIRNLSYNFDAVHEIRNLDNSTVIPPRKYAAGGKYAKGTVEDSMVEVDIGSSQDIGSSMMELNFNLPVGWQRKVFQKTNINGKKSLHVKYLNPEGELFRTKRAVYIHLLSKGIAI